MPLESWLLSLPWRQSQHGEGQWVPLRLVPYAIESEIRATVKTGNEVRIGEFVYWCTPRYLMRQRKPVK